MANAGRNDRVTASVTVSIRSSRALRHRIVPFGAAVVELRGEVGNLTTRRLIDRLTKGPGDGDLVGEWEFGAQQRLGGAERRPFDPGDEARRQHRRDQRQSQHEAGMACADRDGAGPNRWSLRRHGRCVEHLVHEVEPDPADRERHGGDDRRRAGNHGQPGEPQREQQCATHGGHRRGRTLDGRPSIIPSGRALTSSADWAGL